MSSMEQQTGSMLMTRQEEEQRHTHRETVPRHTLQTAMNRDMNRPEGRVIHACSCQHRGVGTTDRETAEQQTSPPPHNPRSENLTEETQNIFVHVHKTLPITGL